MIAVAPGGHDAESGEEGVKEGGSEEEPCIMEEKSTADEFINFARLF